MSSIDIVIADALVPADFVADLLRDMALPAFDLLAAQGSAVEMANAHGTLLPGWQAWPFRLQGAPNVALGWSRHFAVAADLSRLRYLAQPIHFEVGTQGLALEHPELLELSNAEALALQQDLAETLAERGVTLVGGDAKHWLLDIDPSMAVNAAVAELAVHQDMLPFLPDGPGRRAWHQLSNEVQMQMHQHALNDQRHDLGKQSVSGLWLSGTGTAEDGLALPYRRIAEMSPWIDAWWTDAASSAQLKGVTSLIGPYGNQDWSGFRNALIGIDQHLLQLLQDLRAGEIGAIRVILTGPSFAREVSMRRADLYKFWRRGKAAELFDLPE
jgi:hypothetical protein